MADIAFDFTARVILVTGAAQGIGLAIARSLHAAGAHVVAVDRNRDALEAAWSGDRVTPLALDISDADEVAAAFDTISRSVAPVDSVINNAGIARDSVVWKLSDDWWSSVLEVHLTGTFNVTRAAIPGMRAAGFGRIVNVTSYTGMHGAVGQSNYAAAKGGIIGFTKAVAKEVARFGITANAVSPNALTPMVEAVGADRLAEMTSTVPLQRFADPSEIAPAFGFLLSRAADYITGVVLPVDGGVSM